MAISYREYFHLTQYSEEFIEKIIDYRMHKDEETNCYLGDAEIAKRENCSVEDVKRIISATAIVWNH